MARVESLQTQMSPEEDARLRSSTGAPEGEPEAWDRTIVAYNPHLGHTPEPPPVVPSPQFAARAFDVEEYLAEERAKDLFRFSTAGSVDDGKSTLIGRLLYDTQSVYDDQVRSIEGKGTTAPGVLDLALLTDGLRAEREQGITIDVAYRYFSTARRKFIIADAPGHEQYTRNMATGASTADAAIILIDARKGVLTQSRRHAFITALLGVPSILVAINKMDLVGYQQQVFEQIAADFGQFFRSQRVAGIEKLELLFVPVSALEGENVVHPSTAMPWYQGPTLLNLLETLPSSQWSSTSPFRFAVQRVVRPDLDFRGFAGQIASGTIQRGDSVTVLPSGRRSYVKDIVTFDGSLERASAPMSITLTLEDELDISRGDVLAASANPATVTSSLHASLVWMDAIPLDLSRRYILKHMSRTVQATVPRVHSVADMVQEVDTKRRAGATLDLNEIGWVDVNFLQPLAVDTYAENRRTGSFVLIDPVSNLTVAAGMILATQAPAHDKPTASLQAVSSEEKRSRYGHVGAHLELAGSTELLDALERALFHRGAFVVRLEDGHSAATAVAASGALVLSRIEGPQPYLRATTVAATYDIEVSELDLHAAIDHILDELRSLGILEGSSK